jgi:hypothetical protein
LIYQEILIVYHVCHDKDRLIRKDDWLFLFQSRWHLCKYKYVQYDSRHEETIKHQHKYTISGQKNINIQYVKKSKSVLMEDIRKYTLEKGKHKVLLEGLIQDAVGPNWVSSITNPHECNFFYFNPFEKYFSQVDLKLILFLDLGKGVRLGSALGELQGIRSLGARPVHVD